MFKVFLIYHSHIDIGYTERQEKIANYQANFIKQAVEAVLSDEQNKRDNKNKFRFTAEGFWAVEQYLKSYKEQGKKALLDAINTGYFELTAGYAHLSELLNYNNLNHSLDYASNFTRENGLANTNVAMSCDVNGFSWGFADALYDHGVRFLSTCINTHHGNAPFGKPLVPFWWETPKGRKILVWNGLAYHKANLLGIIPGLAPGGNPFIPGMLPDDSSFVNINGPDYGYGRITQMIKALKNDGYKYEFLPLMGSALYTDNSPVDDNHCELIAQWNEKYGDKIELVTATLGEYFEYLKNNGGEFETCSGDWNDWWTDGVISTPNETKLFRNAQRTNELIKKIDPDMKIVDAIEHEAIENVLITYAEHTWGHSGSLTNPYKLLVNQLDARKTKLAVDADVLACGAQDKLLRVLGEGEFTSCRPFKYGIMNPHDFVKTDVVYLHIDFWEEGHFDAEGFCVVDEEGNIILSQKTQTLRGSVIACTVTLLPHEKKTVFVKFSADIIKSEDIKNNILNESDCFENEFLKITYGKDGITAVKHKQSGEDILISGNEKLGEPVYQLFPNGERGDAAGFGYTKRVKPAMEMHKATMLCTTLVESGDVFTHLVCEFKIKGAVKCSTHYYLYNHLPKIFITVDIAKDLVMDPEGMYVALPLQVSDGEWYLDKAGAFFKPGTQLPVGNMDYYPVNRGIVLSGKNLGIAVTTFDTPLISINKVKLWDHTSVPDTSGTVYSWLTNNKWETNFRSQCAGYLESRYIIEFDSMLNNHKNGLQTLEANEYDFLVFRA